MINLSEEQKQLLIDADWTPRTNGGWMKYDYNGYYVSLNTEEEILEEVETLEIQKTHALQYDEYCKRRKSKKFDSLVSKCVVNTTDGSFILKLNVELNYEEIQDLLNLTGIHNTETYIGWAILEKLKQINDNKSSKLST